MGKITKLWYLWVITRFLTYVWVITRKVPAVDDSVKVHEKSPLLPDRRQQKDFFVCDIFDAAPKADMASMAHPIFSLSTKPDHRVKRYEDTSGSNYVEVKPSHDGLATIEFWHDLYGEIAVPFANNTEEMPLVRGVLKRVGVELIGTGNPLKAKPSKELIADTGITQELWDTYRSALVDHIPALELMDSDYLNGAGFISYHESQMMLLSLQALMAIDVPAYPVHDCLIVKASDKDKAMQVFRNTVRSYILDQCKDTIECV